MLENPDIDRFDFTQYNCTYHKRKCIIFGLPFFRKFPVEFHYNMMTFRPGWQGQVGVDALGFRVPKLSNDS